MSNQLAVGLAATGWRAMSSMRRSSPPSRGSASSSRAIPNARPPIPAPTSCPTRPTCDIEVLVVATPNRAHVAVAVAALERGLAVVVDKPLAASARDAEPLVAQPSS